MEFINLHGTDDRLFSLVARLVMDPEVLRQNNNYPFKTSPQYTWHLCIENGSVIGFLPAKEKGDSIYIDNYYIRDDNHDVLDGLIAHVLESTDKPVTALCHKRHTETFASHGFTTCLVFAKYNKMQTGCVNR